MTVSATARRAGPYACDGVDTSFDFAFKVFADADIRVVLATSAGAESDLTLTTHYTVSRNADQENNPGGSITTVGASSPYAAGNTITIVGNIAYTQTADITNAGGFFPEVVENALDRVTILAQQLKELFARVISFPASDSGPSGELVSAANRASKWLAFDASGNPIASTTTPASSVVSAYMGTVLDDTTAAAARATLGAVASAGDSPSFAAVTVTGAATIASVAGAAVATQADQETGTSTTTVVSPGRQAFHQSAIKGRCKFGVSGDVSAAYNVDSVADNGAGLATVTWGTDFSSSNYAAHVDVAEGAGTGNYCPSIVSTGMAAGTLQVQNVSSGSRADPVFWCVSASGDQ